MVKPKIMRKLIQLLFLTLIIFFSCSKKIEIKKLDIIKYEINLSLDTLKKSLIIESKIIINKPDSLKAITFLFSDLAIIESLKQNNQEIKKYSHKNDTLRIDSISDNKIVLYVNYTLPLDSFENNGNITLTRPMRWCPFIYDDISSLSTTIKLPDDYIAFSSGKRLESELKANIYQTSNEINAGLPIIISKKDYYHNSTKHIGNLNINFHFHTNDSILVKSIINECVKTVDFCNEYIGDYNKEQLTFIEFPNAFYCQSLETFLLAGDGFVKYFKYPGMGFWVSHETIHQWIGSGYFVTIHKDNNLRWFIEESLTEYIRYQFIEEQYGKDSLQGQLEWAIDTYYKEIEGSEQDITIAQNEPKRVVYVIGPLIYHWIRIQIGDKKWQQFIRKLYSENYGTIINYQIFKETLFKYTNEKTIKKYEKWVQNKGIPNEIEKMVRP